MNKTTKSDIQAGGTTLFSAQDSSSPKAANAQMTMPAASLLFQAPDLSSFTKAPSESGPVKRRPNTKAEEAESGPVEDAAPTSQRRTRKRGGEEKKSETSSCANDATKRKRKDSAAKATSTPEKNPENLDGEDTTSSRRRRRRAHSDENTNAETAQVAALEGSTRLEAKRIRRKAGRKEGRKRTPITEAEFLARRENVKREMVVRERDGLNQIAVLEDGLLVEHYVSRHTQTTMVGNIYLGKVQNVLSSMEAAFVDIGKGRNAVLYAGEVNWDAAGMSAKTGRIEDALNPGDHVLVQVTKDPIGHKGARLTSQITLAGRHVVLVPSGAMTGISRKLPEEERKRLKAILKQLIPAGFGVIVRTAAEGATEEQLRSDVESLTKIWAELEEKQKHPKNAPLLLHSEPELAVRVVRDIFNEDFTSLTIQGDTAWKTISKYVADLSPELQERLRHWKDADDVFAAHRIDEQLAKGFERKVWLPSGGYLIIDRTEAMTVVDVNTGRYIGQGGTLEETVTKNNLEAAEEIVRQLRLRDIGGIVVIDFVDMVIESNRDLVLRRLVECLGRDRTRHQVTEVTSLGLVQMTRKRVGQGLVEAFSTTCECCEGRGFIVHDAPVENNGQAPEDLANPPTKYHNRSGRGSSNSKASRNRESKAKQVEETKPEVRQAMAGIAAAAHKEEDTSSSTRKSMDTEPSAETAANTETSTGTPARNRRCPAKTTAATSTQKEPNLEGNSPLGQTPAPRRHRRAASTGVINTDSGADIVVLGKAEE